MQHIIMKTTTLMSITCIFMKKKTKIYIDISTIIFLTCNLIINTLCWNIHWYSLLFILIVIFYDMILVGCDHQAHNYCSTYKLGKISTIISNLNNHFYINLLAWNLDSFLVQQKREENSTIPISWYRYQNPVHYDTATPLSCLGKKRYHQFGTGLVPSSYLHYCLKWHYMCIKNCLNVHYFS